MQGKVCYKAAVELELQLKLLQNSEAEYLPSDNPNK